VSGVQFCKAMTWIDDGSNLTRPKWEKEHTLRIRIIIIAIWASRRELPWIYPKSYNCFRRSEYSPCVDNELLISICVDVAIIV